MAPTKQKSEPGENPLVPNARLREIHLAMLTARTLEERVAHMRRKAGRRSRLLSIRGEEAVRASVTLQLADSDLISDGALAAGAASMLHEDARSILKAFVSDTTDTLSIPRLLPLVNGVEERLQLALGASLALKAQGMRGVVAAYVHQYEVSPAVFRRIFKSAAANILPMIFIILPGSGSRTSHKNAASLAKIAGQCRVPAIPVDACDAVALYRIAQESLGRARSGDGPVLIECVPWLPAGKRRSDPIDHIESFLLARHISTPAQLRSARTTALKRLRSRLNASK